MISAVNERNSTQTRRECLVVQTQIFSARGARFSIASTVVSRLAASHRPADDAHGARQPAGDRPPTARASGQPSTESSTCSSPTTRHPRNRSTYGWSFDIASAARPRGDRHGRDARRRDRRRPARGAGADHTRPDELTRRQAGPSPAPTSSSSGTAEEAASARQRRLARNRNAVGAENPSAQVRQRVRTRGVGR
jgi:hypothetical protein